ncbi:MAG: pilus assembly protein TadG-related protein [Planctomycetaceae bacterium]
MGALHSNERGTISILSVFTLLMFTMLLMMVFNVAKQHDDKVRMQNAADAAAYSGGVILARGMNALAFSNHLEADVFAVTAFLREARDRNAAGYVPEVLSAWVTAGGKFSGAQFPKFQGLDQAITATVPLEQQFVTAWSQMASAAAQAMLPVFQHILGTPDSQSPGARDHLIPEFQRSVVTLVPSLAQDMTLEIALRHGLRQQDLDRLNTNMFRQSNFGAGVRGPQVGILWRTSVMPVSYSGETDPQTRTLPVVDPEPYQSDYGAMPNGADYLQAARYRRELYAREYLRQWVADMDISRGLGMADQEAAMSQFARLFYSAACGQLLLLLNNEYQNSNVPFVLRNFQTDLTSQRIDVDYTYVGVAYRRHVDVMAPRMYRNPLSQSADAQTYAAVTVFIPRARFHCCPWAFPVRTTDSSGNPQVRYVDNLDPWPFEWSTFNQNWTCKLVPATSHALPDILAANPGGPAQGFRMPALNGAQVRDVRALNTH